MRTILYTGKGGVGKTSVAAASALRCAQLGYKTIVLSTDLAHSLADSLDVTLGAEPRQVAPNLWAQEVDVYHEVHRHWGTLQDYVYKMLTWRGLDEIIAEEMTIFPGMDELSSLLLITRYEQEGNYDVCIVDCAPTGETLRLLSFPEVARWWLKNILPVQRRVSQVIRPVVKRVTDIPMPDDAVFEAVQHFLTRLDEVHTLLADPERSTVRLVLNAEKMVIKEAQRTYTYLNLYNYNVDAIICNRIIPDAATNGYFGAWKEIQGKYTHLVEECFAPLPILRTPMFDEEVVGLRMLGKLADAAFEAGDPAKVLFRGQTHTLAKDGDSYVLSIPLPLVTKPEIEMLRAGDELVLRIGSQRRNIVLPRAVAALETREAKFEAGVLRVRFAPAPTPEAGVAIGR